MLGQFTAISGCMFVSVLCVCVSACVCVNL